MLIWLREKRKTVETWEWRMAMEYEPINAYGDEIQDSLFNQEKHSRMKTDNAEKTQDYDDDGNKELSQLALQIHEPAIASKGEEGPLIPSSSSTILPLHKQQPPQQQRLVSLDVFRGLTIVVKSNSCLPFFTA